MNNPIPVLADPEDIKNLDELCTTDLVQLGERDGCTDLELALANRLSTVQFYLGIALSQCEATSSNENIYDDDTDNSISIEAVRDIII
jgi:hypothetical protein